MGYNYTFGKMKYQSDVGRLHYIQRNPEEYLDPYSEETHLPDGSNKYSQRNKIYLQDDGNNIKNCHGSGYLSGEKVHIKKNSNGEWIDAWVLNTLPLSVSLHKIPDGTKLPYFTSDIEYVTKSWQEYPLIKRYYNGAGHPLNTDNIFTDIRFNQNHNIIIPNSKYTSTDSNNIGFEIWTGNDGTGYLTVWEDIDKSLTNPTDDSPWKFDNLVEEGKYTYDKNT